MDKTTKLWKSCEIEEYIVRNKAIKKGIDDRIEETKQQLKRYEEDSQRYVEIIRKFELKYDVLWMTK